MTKKEFTEIVLNLDKHTCRSLWCSGGVGKEFSVGHGTRASDAHHIKFRSHGGQQAPRLCQGATVMSVRYEITIEDTAGLQPEGNRAVWSNIQTEEQLQRSLASVERRYPGYPYTVTKITTEDVTKEFEG